MYYVASHSTYLSLIFNLITYSQEKRHLRKISFGALPFQRKVHIRCSKFVILFPSLKKGIIRNWSGLSPWIRKQLHLGFLFLKFLIAHISKEGKGCILWQLCKQKKSSLSPTAIRMPILKHQRSEDFCCGLPTPSRLDSAGLTQEKESHQLQVKLCPSKGY